MMKIHVTLFSLFVLGLNMAISACAELPGSDIITISTQKPSVLIDNPYSSVSNNFIRTFYERVQGQPESFVLKERGKLNAIKNYT